MMHEPQPNAPETGRQDTDLVEQCTDCGADVIEDPDNGLNCARCGQWEALCEDCMPKSTEYTRDNVWCCPECRERPLDS